MINTSTGMRPKQITDLCTIPAGGITIQCVAPRRAAAC
jgi:hypothetical protein